MQKAFFWIAAVALTLPLLSASERAFERVSESAAGKAALKDGINPWHYWGTYSRNARLVKPVWRERDDVIHGWDWSLPPAVKPSPRAKLRWGFHGWKRGQLQKAGFPDGFTLIDEIWWSWRDLEPEEGHYDFGGLKDAIRERIDAGCHGVFIRLLGSVWENGTPEQIREWK